MSETVERSLESTASVEAPDGTSVEVAATAIAPWTMLVVGSPGDGTMLLVDWLMMACAQLGCAARAVPIAATPDRPHGMIVEVASSCSDLERLPAVPSTAADVMIAGEHLELARAVAAGWVSPERTVVIASCVRSYSQLERVVAPEHVVREAEIDAMLRDSSRHYVAFNGPQVAGWYSMPSRVQPGLLLGALVGTGMTPVSQEAAQAAVARIGIDVEMHVAALRRGIRLGKRPGGRVQRALTAQQFVRKRRGSLPRSERAGFEALISRVEASFSSSLHAQLRESVVRLVDYHDCTHGSAYLDRCSYVLGSGDVPDDIALTFVRNLAHLMICQDPAYAAHMKLQRGRLASVRRSLRISRNEPYSLVDAIVVERDERIAGWLARRRGSVIHERGPILGDAPQQIRCDATSIRGVRKLRRLARQRVYRRESARFEREMETVEAYVACMNQVVVGAPDLMRIVAESGSMVQGSAAVRLATAEAGRAFWGRIVRQAVTIDQSRQNDEVPVANIIVPHVWKHMCETGPLALWEYCGGVVGIAMQHSRGARHEQVLAWARALCGEEAAS